MKAFISCRRFSLTKWQVVSVSTILIASGSTYFCISYLQRQLLILLQSWRSADEPVLWKCAYVVPLLTEVLLKLVEVLWVRFIQNMHKLALITVVIMRETCGKIKNRRFNAQHVAPNSSLDPKWRKRYKNLASMLWSQNTDMYDLLFITDPSRTTLTASVDTRTHTCTHSHRHTEIKVGLL